MTRAEELRDLAAALRRTIPEEEREAEVRRWLHEWGSAIALEDPAIRALYEEAVRADAEIQTLLEQPEVQEFIRVYGTPAIGEPDE